MKLLFITTLFFIANCDASFLDNAAAANRQPNNHRNNMSREPGSHMMHMLSDDAQNIITRQQRNFQPSSHLILPPLPPDHERTRRDIFSQLLEQDVNLIENLTVLPIILPVVTLNEPTQTQQ